MNIRVSSGASAPPPKSKRSLAYVAATAGALVVAFASGLGSDLASRAATAVAGDKPVVSASAVEAVYECGTGLFVEEPRAQKIADGKLETVDWAAFKKKYGAVQAGQSVVGISILGEAGERSVTLTGIRVKVLKRSGPVAGATFAHPCGDGTYGRSLLVDLDTRPPRIEASNVDIDGQLEVSTKPIRFPWRVSLKEELLIYVVARTKGCHCRYGVDIDWQSGAKSGVISLPKDGKGFAIAPSGPRTYVGPYEDGWRLNQTGQ